MGLSIAGQHSKAKKALEWMAAIQEDDGGLWPACAEDKPLDTTRKFSKTEIAQQESAAETACVT